MEQIKLIHQNGNVIILPERGRVLQVQVRDHDAFWTNPNFGGAEDWNIGGDRLWQAPEADWHWQVRGQYDFEKYVVPAAMDPGQWQTNEETGQAVAVSQMVTLKHQHTGRDFSFLVQRRFELVESPAENQALKLEDEVAFRTWQSLSLRAGTLGQKIGLWNILQVPAGGTMWIAGHFEGPQYRDYFAPIPAEYYEVRRSGMVFKIDGNQQYKIGIGAEPIQGRLAYGREVGNGEDGKMLVMLREFKPGRPEQYCDVPLSDPHDSNQAGDTAQIYNDDGSFGHFGEMEFHCPGLIYGQGDQTMEDTFLTRVGFMDKADFEKMTQ